MTLEDLFRVMEAAGYELMAMYQTSYLAGDARKGDAWSAHFHEGSRIIKGFGRTPTLALRDCVAKLPVKQTGLEGML